MKKSQAVLLHLLILAILGGFTGFCFSIQQDKDTNLVHFQKNGLTESVSTFIAEEEVNIEQSNLRRTQFFLTINFEVWEPSRIIAPREFYTSSITFMETEKKFLLHLQLLL